MQILLQVLFVMLSVGAIFLFVKKIYEIRRNILLGKDKNLTDYSSQRWRNVLLNAFGQKKMFKNPLVAVLHFFVYVGFIIINVEILEIILDGLTGKHRLFAPVLGSLYSLLIGCFEILALTVLIACTIFLIRRNILKVKRLNIGELLTGWPRNDANIILLFEVVLMSLFLIMNACDLNLQQLGSTHYPTTDRFWISQFIAPVFSSLSETSLIVIERIAWWAHIIGIFVFMNYLPYSKHLHVLLAFPNAYYASLDPKGKMTNMKEVQNEVLYMMQPELAPSGEDANQVMKFGARDVIDLSWKNLMDAYSCTECGRCSAACPANTTGKKLSPRKIMMDTRDRLEEVGTNINKNKSFVDDGKSLLHDYITAEELRACTTCNACVEQCPVSISPLDIILQLRRNLVMEESNAPQEWNMMFSNIENNMAPWKFSPDDRDAWIHQ
ncbi:MAG: (Fe-S)-binding protein [Chitinophagaceae bacterium]|nr:(Fe-S)-binding protein [Chitinophagaceae bacterium]HMN32836.1 (Fe-S)-binding protein [Chitinophagaceae bacterium]